MLTRNTWTAVWRGVRPQFRKTYSSGYPIYTPSELGRIAREYAPRGEKANAEACVKRLAGLRTQPGATLRRRLTHYLWDIGTDEIERRRISTPAGYEPRLLGCKDYDPSSRCWVLGGSWRYKYSLRAGEWRQNCAYLIGRDEGQLFAVRIPSTISTVYSALSWLTPAPVRNAREAGRAVYRQGDIFFAEICRLKADDMTALDGTRHRWNEKTRYITHGQHKPIRLPRRCRFRAYRSMQVSGTGRIGAD